MMINTINHANFVSSISSHDNENTDFNNRVLQYIRHNRPTMPLNELIHDLSELTPSDSPTLHSLTAALQYTDSTLRNETEFKEYSYETLDGLTSQSLGVRMLLNNMLNRLITPIDEDSPI